MAALQAAQFDARKDKRRRAILALVVRGMDAVAQVERAKEERRLREAVLDFRALLYGLLHSHRLSLAALPIILDAAWGDVAGRGAASSLITKRIRELVGAAAGAAPQPQRGRVLPTVPKRIKVSVNTSGDQKRSIYILGALFRLRCWWLRAL